MNTVAHINRSVACYSRSYKQVRSVLQSLIQTGQWPVTVAHINRSVVCYSRSYKQVSGEYSRSYKQVSGMLQSLI